MNLHIIIGDTLKSELTSFRGGRTFSRLMESLTAMRGTELKTFSFAVMLSPASINRDNIKLVIFLI